MKSSRIEIPLPNSPQTAEQMAKQVIRSASCVLEDDSKPANFARSSSSRPRSLLSVGFNQRIQISPFADRS